MRLLLGLRFWQHLPSYLHTGVGGGWAGRETPHHLVGITHYRPGGPAPLPKGGRGGGPTKSTGWCYCPALFPPHPPGSKQTGLQSPVGSGSFVTAAVASKDTSIRKGLPEKQLAGMRLALTSWCHLTRSSCCAFELRLLDTRSKCYAQGSTGRCSRSGTRARMAASECHRPP